MKKSKIIVPALLILTLSTAAAVTGTVAWFTGSRLVTISASAITAFDPEAGLKVTLADVAHTSTTTAEGHADTPAAITIGALRDGSVDLTSASTATVYKANLNAEGNGVASFATVASPYDAQTVKIGGNDVTLGYAAAYTATFALDKTTSSASYNLFYDHTKMVATNTNSLAIAPGLRIGIKTTLDFVVIAPFKASGDLQYVSGTASNAISTYATGNCFYSSTASGEKQIGSGLTGTGTIVATVYTWFEGTDDATVSNNVDAAKSLSVSLGFKIAPAA